jgi:mannan endo-1,4-beta-mannosidase
MSSPATGAGAPAGSAGASANGGGGAGLSSRAGSGGATVNGGGGNASANGGTASGASGNGGARPGVSGAGQGGGGAASTSTGGLAGGGQGGAGAGAAGGGGGHTGGGAGAGAAGSGGGQALTQTLVTNGRQLLDVCGNPLVIRGVEQVLGDQLPQGNDWAGLIDDVASTGANAIRIEPSGPARTAAVLEQIMDRLALHRMVAFIEPSGRAWFNQADVKTVLQKHLWHLTLDAFAEPTYDDPTMMMADWKAGVNELRGYGYKVPLIVISNQYGRDLPTALASGAEIVAADPEHNVIVGWQAYWSTSGYYQGVYGMTLAQGVKAASSAAFPIQIGIDYRTDPSIDFNDPMDYGAVMTAAQQYGVGWLWWEWYNPYNNLENSLSSDGSATQLTTFGSEVVHTHAASIEKTAQLPCRPN